jgi:Fe2+ or Zn2+ uptake regulation protein
VDETDIKAGAALSLYFAAHYQKVIEVLGTDERKPAAERVLNWITRNGKTQFSTRDVYRCLCKSFKRSEDLYPPLRVLEQHGYIRRVHKEQSDRGRKPSFVYEVNPYFLKSG